MFRLYLLLLPFYPSIRKSLFSALSALSECWQLLITDYGVVPSIFASITIAALIFLMFLMLRSVSPKRTRHTSPPPDKRKKKRKGHTRRGTNGKVKMQPSTPSRQLETPTSTTISIDPQSPASSTSTSCSSPESFPLIPNLPVDNPTPSQHATPTTFHVLDETPKELPGPKPMATPILQHTSTNSSKTIFEKDNRGRVRVPSVSTIDTTTLSDDMSCESTSIRSELSVHVPFTPSNHAMPVQQEILPPATSTDTPADQPGKRGARTQPRRNNRPMGTGNTKSKLNHSPKSTGNDVTSRWDALRPAPNSKHTNIHPHAPERHNLSPRHPETSRPNHLHPGPRPTMRRNGRGGGNPRRGGRTGAANVNHNLQTTGLPQTPSSSPRPKQFSAPSPISPPNLERCPRGNSVMPPASVPTLPPPGLGAIASTRNNNVAAESTLFFSVQPKTSADVPSLFPSLPADQLTNSGITSVTAKTEVSLKEALLEAPLSVSPSWCLTSSRASTASPWRPCPC